LEVHAIQTGTVAVKTGHREGRGRRSLRLARTLIDSSWTEALPVYAWLIEHPEGLIIVDTGETARIGEPGYLPRWHPFIRRGARAWVRPEDEVGPRLEALGFSAGDVRWVIMTHLHTDHAGGLAHFPKSEILVCRAEFEHARGQMGKVRGFLPHRWPASFSPRLIDLEPEPYGPFPESFRVTGAGDVTIVAAHGHTKGHVGVVVEEERQALLFAGDTAYSEALMLEGAIDGIALNERAARDTLRRIQEFTRQRPVVYLPSHDPDAERRLVARQTCYAGSRSTDQHQYSSSPLSIAR
jgi:glyoxylase-like metal-dependent hydrolase (beta-lactamase superfamily II)